MGLLGRFFKRLIGKTIGYADYKARSSPFMGSELDNDIFRATVDTIATHAAKGQVKHVMTDSDGKIKKVLHNSPYAKLLNMKPNPIMSGFEFKYRMFSQLEAKTTAVAWIKWDGTVPEMICPVDYSTMEMYEVVGGGYAIKFRDYQGNSVLLPLEECIVMRKFYTDKEACGDGNRPIYKVFDMSKASDEGFVECLNVSNKVRGLFKHKKAMLDKEDVEQSQQEFADRFRKASMSGGIVSIDSMEEYTPLNAGNTFAATATQMNAISSRIYSYLRTSEKIVQSTYSEQEGLAWYESVIEPLWEMFSEAISNACFTQREKDVGNKIIISGGVLMGSSYQTRINIISQTKEIGILTTNEQRELLGLAPVEGGDERQVSLNYVKASEQSVYQGKKGENDGKGGAE